MREAAAKLLLAAGHVDADAVWLVLFDLGSCYQDLEQLLALSAAAPAAGEGAAAADVRCKAGGEIAAGTAAGQAPDTPAAPPLPKLQQLPPRASTKHAAGEASSMQRLLCSSDGVSCGKRAAALLPRVAQLPVAWHVRAEQQLLELQSARAL